MARCGACLLLGAAEADVLGAQLGFLRRRWVQEKERAASARGVCERRSARLRARVARACSADMPGFFLGAAGLASPWARRGT